MKTMSLIKFMFINSAMIENFIGNNEEMLKFCYNDYRALLRSGKRTNKDYSIRESIDAYNNLLAEVETDKYQEFEMLY